MNGNIISQSLSFYLSRFSRLSMTYEFQTERARKKFSLLVCGEHPLIHSTSPPSFIDLVQQICLLLYGHTPLTNIYINTSLKPHPNIYHSPPWNISASYKSAVLTLPNMKSSDAVSTYGTQRTHTWNICPDSSLVYGAQSISYIQANAGN